MSERRPAPDPGPNMDEVVTRNWQELLQELRVTQTGSQILTGFLLTVPFNARFAGLPVYLQRVYLAVLLASVVAAGLILAPVAYHRLLFRRRQRPWLVLAAHHAARAGLILLALDSAGVVFLVFDVVTSIVAAAIAAAAVLVLLGLLWLAVPLTRADSPPQGG